MRIPALIVQTILEVHGLEGSQILIFRLTGISYETLQTTGARMIVMNNYHTKDMSKLTVIFDRVTNCKKAHYHVGAVSTV